MIKVDKIQLSDKELSFLDDLICALVVDIIRSDEVEKLLEEGILKDVDDWKDVQADARAFLAHICDHRCLQAIGNGKFVCWKLNNLYESSDNTSHIMKPLPSNFTPPCIQKLLEIGIIKPFCVSSNGFVPKFKSDHPFLNPVCHIPPTNPSDDMNISPVEGVLFATCLSMQNVQRLTECGSVNTYVCKYIGKIDNGNYVVAFTDSNKHGGLVSRATFLHNTKISSLKINEEKNRESQRGSSHMSGQAISEMEMLHHILKYLEVVTDLVLMKVNTVVQDLRSNVPGLSTSLKATKIDDYTYNESTYRAHLDIWHQHSVNDIRLFDDLRFSRSKVDCISQFLLHPPELHELFDTVGNYFYWFTVSENRVNDKELAPLVDDDIYKSVWFDAFHHKVKVKVTALDEILEHLSYVQEREVFNISNDDSSTQSMLMSPLFCMYELFMYLIRLLRADEVRLDDEDVTFLDFAYEHLVDQECIGKHLTVPVFSYVKPTMGVHFIFHVALSMGRFASEVNICLQPSLHESLRYSKLMGPSNDAVELQKYSRNLLKEFILTQLVYFPNSKRVIDSWILSADEIFDTVIVEDNIPISELASAQFSTLFGNPDDKSPDEMYIHKMNNNLVDAALKDLGPAATVFNVPLRDNLLEATLDTQCNWDPEQSYTRNRSQAMSSFEEQRFAIHTCASAILKYTNVLSATSLVKSIGIKGFPGSGKTFCMLYLSLYARSLGLFVTTTAMMANRSIVLGGLHWHKLFYLPTEKNMLPHQRAEYAIARLSCDCIKMNVLTKLDILFCNEMGQVAAELLSVIDIILCHI